MPEKGPLLLKYKVVMRTQKREIQQVKKIC